MRAISLTSTLDIEVDNIVEVLLGCCQILLEALAMKYLGSVATHLTKLTACPPSRRTRLHRRVSSAFFQSKLPTLQNCFHIQDAVLNDEGNDSKVNQPHFADKQ
jgi:hypothetical protein